jgi:phospholipid/cholesterol/gamma-HCH transport system substrate-binding protein
MWANTEFKVGLFVLTCLGIVAAMSFQINNDPTMARKGKRYFAYLPNANGIVKKSTVKMAGIPVGIIHDIVLDDGKAKLLLIIKGDLRLSDDAVLEVRPNGILGDKYVEITQGTPDRPELADNSQIMKTVDQSSFDVVIKQVGKIAADLGDVTAALKGATTGNGSTETPLGRIIKNVESLTADLKDITGENKDRITETLAHLHNISKTIDQFVNDESDDGFKTNFRKMAKSLGKVDHILTNVDEITGKINQGKGTIGKLINDEQTVEELNHAIAGINGMLDTANKFQLELDYHSELIAGGSFVKSFVGVIIQPGPDRYYLVQVIDDPKGSYDQTTTSTVTNGGAAQTQVTGAVYNNRLKFSAEFAKIFYDLTVRAGIIQNSGGFGADYTFFNKKLRFSTEVFGFGRPEGVDVRAYARYKFYSAFYVTAGGDDLMNKGVGNLDGTGAAGFIGAGLDFTDDDLKLLLAKAPL